MSRGDLNSYDLILHKVKIMTPLYKYSTYSAIVFVGLALQMALLRKAPFQPLGVVQNGVVWATVTNEDNILIGKAFSKWSVSLFTVSNC